MDSQNSSLSRQVEFALEVTTSIIWSMNVETGETEMIHGPAAALFNTESDLGHGIESFVHTIVHPDDQHRVEQVYADVRQGKTDEFDVVFRTHPDHGEISWIDTHGRVQTDDDTRLLTGISTDITERKRREQELERQNERLEDFASILSHDLRNPLNVVEGRLELVREDIDNEDLDRAIEALNRMETLIDDLLAFARAGSPITRGGRQDPTQQLERVDVSSLAEESWRSIDADDATLQIDADQTIHADEHQLKQLFENLFRNAIEHAGPTVTVTVGTLDPKNGFYVADDGPGIPESERDEIFERGYSTSDDGIGLGLSIVEGVVDAHGWNIAVTESPNGGARFEITSVERA